MPLISLIYADYSYERRRENSLLRRRECEVKGILRLRMPIRFAKSACSAQDDNYIINHYK